MPEITNRAPSLPKKEIKNMYNLSIFFIEFVFLLYSYSKHSISEYRDFLYTNLNSICLWKKYTPYHAHFLIFYVSKISYTSFTFDYVSDHHKTHIQYPFAIAPTLYSSQNSSASYSPPPITSQLETSPTNRNYLYT